MDKDIQFGQRLRVRREEVGVSVAQLSMETDIARSTISRLERGEAQPTLDVVLALANALRIRPAVLAFGPQLPTRLEQALDSLAGASDKDIEFVITAIETVRRR